MQILARLRETGILEVADTGPGIDSEILPRLFEPGVTARSIGRGRGLATARTIVETHGGRIQVRSTARGTAFELSFPLAAE